MKPVFLMLIGLLACQSALAQFETTFDDAALATDPHALDGWAFFTGDGAARMDFRQADGAAVITVDATEDQYNIWWALIKHQVSSALDLQRLQEPSHELRIETRIRVSHAPRRVNLHLNTQRTTDFHSHLMEYDIPDTTGWHTISMTTRGFDAVPGDTVYAQLALMDWGRDRYRVAIDYFKVDVVDTTQAGPDVGDPIPYHPSLPDPATFAQRLPVAEDAMIDPAYPDLNLDQWHAAGASGPVRVLTTGGTQWVILRWDLHALKGKQAAGRGLLELPTYALQRAPQEVSELGQIRVVEILGGDPEWEQETVTYNNLLQGRERSDVFNPQMIIDVEVTEAPGGTTYATISRPVLQRLIDGTTRGLALQPLGPIQASFYAQEEGAEPIRLLFDVTE